MKKLLISAAILSLTSGLFAMDDELFRLCKTPPQFAVVSNNNSDDKNDDKNDNNRTPYKETNFGLLQKEVVKEISEFLDLESHLSLSMVCKDLNIYMRDFKFVPIKYLSAARGYLKDKGVNNKDAESIKDFFYDNIFQDRDREKGALFYHLIRLVDWNKTSYADITFEKGAFMGVLELINKQKPPPYLY